ncbi:leucine ABC transporter subunit substrate-binding protein LivK [Thalassovita gelatinovora]|uniref:Leucine ABC transporter subunit substrate-binding protein LivK n=1 Tax=Thalassovita gelatinovora TaxID=53501 RepID=A0A0P1G3Y9_THAGE|nr:ABC transporter substrate-binding protein [Thalassovita gelatinovora]QIZ82069.1 ABC transporter substrate-binding protein [Thalassovita gelatinovora]CUH67588.1 leucine ABC transporter subunit substrate-binding protein LivK [Thalassovita gelatinovora]SEP71299.1 amino acid/amide ABC transporter substrate-binding protein, HAAT family [Thalassovita gelatinovora]
MKPWKAITAAAALTLGLAAPAVQAEMGVTDDEIKIGGAHDLSGIFAPFSVPAVKAAQLYFDEINAAGGVNGRKINYIVEDHGYQVPKAVQAANKLINRDDVFAMLLSLGTPHNIAMFKLMGPKGIPNVSPLTAARQMVDPPESWKFAGTASYYAAVKETTEYLANEQGSKTFCLMYLPTDFGVEIQQGLIDGAAASGTSYGIETKHKPDETDFSGALGKIKQGGCDTVGLALGVSQLINVIATAHKLGMEDLKFVMSSAGFHTVVAKGLAAQGVMGGVYAGAGWQDLEARIGNPEVAAWVKSYTEATGEKFPGTGALLGRSAAELMVKGLEAAGPDLTREGFIKAMEGLKYDDAVAGNSVDMSADNHVAATSIYVSAVENGSWKLIKTIE